MLTKYIFGLPIFVSENGLCEPIAVEREVENVRIMNVQVKKQYSSIECN